MKERFFNRTDWLAFWTATIVTFAVYLFTLGPSVGLEDSGELATAAAHLGVPHPPGYPFWTLCSWIFCKLFFWVTYMGHPNPAWAVSCCSAVFGALAAGFTAMLISRSSQDFTGSDKWIAFGGAVGGALTFALSPVEWSQSTIVEIYSLNAFFLMLVFLLSYRWMRQPTDKLLWTTAFVFGLGLTNYQVLVFAVVPLAIIILMRNLSLFRDVFIYLIPVALTYQLMKIGAMDRACAEASADVINKHLAVGLDAAGEMAVTTSCPSSFLTAAGIVILVGCMAAAHILKKRGEETRSRTLMLYGGGTGAVTILLAGVLFTSKNVWTGVTLEVAPLIEPVRYSLIAAAVAGSAAMSAAWAMFGDKRQLWASAGLSVLAVLIAFTVPFAGNAGYLGEPYPWFKSIMVFLALIAVLFALCRLTPKGLAFAIPVAGLHIAAFVLLKAGALNGLTHPQSWWFWWPVAWNMVMLALAAIALPNGLSMAGAAFFALLGVSFYAYMPLVSELRNPPMNWGYPRTWAGFKHAFLRAQYEAIGFNSFSMKQVWHYLQDVVMQFTDVLLIFAPVPFIAGHWVVDREHKKTFWQWMIAAASCFLMMSVLLIVLAGVKGDVQDGFIQKVKFISSHAMIALWIGYGLAFAGAAALRFAVPKIPKLKPGHFAIGFAAVTILTAFAFPVIQNYTDKRMVFELGGSEQNGHTFGWQFGAYQLEGFRAIEEQLTADEEPLPDDTYPPPMEEHAIFFGGTDPGRFVPTYMIYCADFRPDVYLITQNALADDKYLAVERDLYGDEIWIPSKEDGNEAFRMYVNEVRRGMRTDNGNLQLQNGRVQVTGALEVMKINWLLARMMYDHDKDRHAFYVEESYRIPWMYPFLSPNGLIMKVNAEESPYDRKRAAQDADFWDWYARRLLDDPMYRRDFAAQKSFSKLRSALAGLYAWQGRSREASQAFREACILYPASPEATFRYMQECLLPERKWDVVLEALDFTDSIDPNNSRTADVRKLVLQCRWLYARIAQLNAQRQQEGEKFSDDNRFELADCYYMLGHTLEAMQKSRSQHTAGMIMSAAQMVRTLIDTTGDTKRLAKIAAMLTEAQLDGDAERCLNRYLKSNSRDWAAWCSLAKLQYRHDRVSAAVNSLRMAYRIDKDSVTERILGDEELMEIYGRAQSRR